MFDHRKIFFKTCMLQKAVMDIRKSKTIEESKVLIQFKTNIVDM